MQNQRSALHNLNGNSMRHVYNTLQPISVSAVRRGVDQFAKNVGLDARTTQEIQKAINVHTVDDFKEGIVKCEAWFRRVVKGRPYALLIEYSRQQRDWPKSSLWLAHRVVAALGPPVEVVEIDYWKGVHNLDSARLLGAKCLVHLQDAVYSGIQVSEMINVVSRKLIMLNKKRSPLEFPIYVAAAYGTRVGYNRVENAVKLYMHGNRHNKKIAPSSVSSSVSSVYIAKILTPSRLPQILTAAMAGRNFDILDAAPTLSIMPHKVPNHVSFGAKVRSGTVRRMLDVVVRREFPSKKMEPYKAIPAQRARENLNMTIAVARNAAKKKEHIQKLRSFFSITAAQKQQQQSFVAALVKKLQRVAAKSL